MSKDINKERFDVPLHSDDQSMKNCKKVTPCGITKNDIVYVDETISLVNKSKIEAGYYVFDSYDKYDNTIYIISNYITKNILYSAIREITKEEKTNYKIKVNG